MIFYQTNGLIKFEEHINKELLEFNSLWNQNELVLVYLNR